ncbi:MAG: M28 family peptidase [Acidobacteriota bacterium]|jgi:glutaminyl-peptide cyclotransferase
MRYKSGFIYVLILIFCSCQNNPEASSLIPELSGENAMEYVRTQVSFGPRPSGSEQLQKCREFIEGELRSFGYEVEDDEFTTETPYGSTQMHNLIARKGSSNNGVIVLASHYETKLMEGKKFVGANDPGSSAGLLLELARVLATKEDPLDYWFLFTDGEEAFVEWSTFDSTYGSRHLAKRWKQEGVVEKIKALILIDMIGDKDLHIHYETNSTPWLMDLVWEAAGKIGFESILSLYKTSIQDDHIPFLDVGIPCVDIIDLSYGPNNAYWHTEQDTLDKISPQSMEKVGRLVLEMLPEIQKRR